jgi:hypothetical protein
MIFDERNFTKEEKDNIKIILEDTMESLRSINDLKEHINENLKGLCERLNTNVEHSEQKIKPGVLMKMATTKMKENLHEQKDKLSEVEVGLELIYS